MSKKQKYKVFYNESMNSIVAIESHLKKNDSPFCEYIGTFTRKQIKRIEIILRYCSLSLSEIQYMIDMDSKFRYTFVFGKIHYYENGINGRNHCSLFIFPIEEKEQLPESDSIHLKNDDCIQACRRINRDSQIDDVMNAIFSPLYSYEDNELSIKQSNKKQGYWDYLVYGIPRDMRP
jgi:hypothetical protein